MKKPRALVIDGNNLIYRCYYGMPYLSTPDGQVIHGTFGTINRVREALKLFVPTKAFVCWDGSQAHKSWRHEYYPPYKAKRRNVEHSEERASVARQITIAMELLNLLMVPQVRSPLVEGDDAIAVVAQKLKIDGYRPVILSPDHDFMQLVDEDVSVYDPMKVLWAREDTFAECMGATKFAGLVSTPTEFLDYMIVNGDTGDGVPMVKGLSGEKRFGKWAPHFKGTPLSKMLTNEDWFDTQCPDDLHEEFVPRFGELHRNWVLLDLKHGRVKAKMEVNEFWPPHEFHNFSMEKFLAYAQSLAFRSVVLESSEWNEVFGAYHRRSK